VTLFGVRRGTWVIILEEGQTVNIYNLVIHVEEIHDGGDYRYVATSPDLPACSWPVTPPRRS